jgi:hypothetical protein
MYKITFGHSNHNENGLNPDFYVIHEQSMMGICFITFEILEWGGGGQGGGCNEG